MARKPTPTPEVPAIQELDAAKVADLQNTGSALAAVASEEHALVNQLLGQAQMADSISKFSRTVRLTKLAYVKENGLYKALAGQKTPNGSALTGTWEEFCNLLGYSKDKVDLDLQNLRAFGEEALESMSRMGIGYREMRQFRRLPDDEKTALIEVAKTGDKEAFVELAEEIITKNAKEKEALQKTLDDTKADYEALSDMLHSRDQDLKDVRMALAESGVALTRAQHRLKDATPDEQFSQLRDECHRAASLIEDGFNSSLKAALEALQAHGESAQEDLTPWMSSLILRMERQLNALRYQFGLPDTLEGEEPAWLNPDALATVEAEVEAKRAAREI